MDTIEAAHGAYCIANANMLRAIRAVSSERGRDPRKFVLYAFGGAGAMHAVGVAQGLGIKTVIVPPVPGVCSAFGLLCADIERHYAQALSRMWDEAALDELNDTFEKISNKAISSVQLWAGHVKVQPYLKRYVDLRYEGQAWELSIPVPEAKLGRADLVTIGEAFEKEHEKTYGHSLTGYPLRLVNLRLVATVPTEGVQLRRVLKPTAKAVAATSQDTGTRKAYWGNSCGWVGTPVIKPEQISEVPKEGPILVDCYDTTIVVPPDCTIATDEWGNIVIKIKSEVA